MVHIRGSYKCNVACYGDADSAAVENAALENAGLENVGIKYGNR